MNKAHRVEIETRSGRYCQMWDDQIIIVVVDGVARAYGMGADREYIGIVLYSWL